MTLTAYEPAVRQICGVDFVFPEYKEPLVQLKGAVRGYMRGTLPYAVSDGRLPCAFCDPTTGRAGFPKLTRTYDDLGLHVRVHGYSSRQYRERIGLLQKTPLASALGQVARRRARAASPGGGPLLRGGSEVHADYRQTPEYQNKRGACPDQIRAVARGIAKRNGGHLTAIELQRQHIGPDAIRRAGWANLRALCEEIGVPPFRLMWTAGEALTALRESAARLGRTPCARELRGLGLPTRIFWEHHFGGWMEACRRAGLPINAPLPVCPGDEVDILNRYALTGSLTTVALQTHRARDTIHVVLARYGVTPPVGRFGAEARLREAREWAAEIARRLAA
jgi:hypothetical protein